MFPSGEEHKIVTICRKKKKKKTLQDIVRPSAGHVWVDQVTAQRCGFESTCNWQMLSVERTSLNITLKLHCLLARRSLVQLPSRTNSLCMPHSETHTNIEQYRKKCCNEINSSITKKLKMNFTKMIEINDIDININQIIHTNYLHIYCIYVYKIYTYTVYKIRKLYVFIFASKLFIKSEVFVNIFNSLYIFYIFILCLFYIKTQQTYFYPLLL